MAATSDALISQGEVEQEDLLSKLPDDVLLSILKNLDLRDFVRSSTLSRRWRHLPGELLDIVLDVDSFKPKDDDGFKSTSSDTARSNMALVYAAKNLLGRKGQRPIRHLAVTFYLRFESMGIVRAVDDAMSPDRGGRGVATAEFTIRGEKMDLLCSEGDMVRHAKRFLSYFNACPRAFAGLTGLHVESVKLGESDMPTVLRACQKLKWLSLLNCDTGGETVLVLEHPQLTDLKLDSCNCDGVELRWLPELCEVSCWSWCPSRHGCPLLFGHVPRLRRLRLCTAGYAEYTTLKLSELLVNYASLGELYLNFQCNRIWIKPEHPEHLTPLLQNLGAVNLDNISEECDLTWTLFLLQCAPFLKMLQIKVSSHQCIPFTDKMNKLLQMYFGCRSKNMEWELPDFKHYNLAVLHIFGFQPGNKFMGYIRRVMEAAVNLEEIALLDLWCEDCGFRPVTRYPRTKQERDFIRTQINEGVISPMKTIQFYQTSSEEPNIKILD
ncbi:hypothetical protein ACP70R_009850 [Stipagrostis hirtigluma subsp. patula]